MAQSKDRGEIKTVVMLSLSNAIRTKAEACARRERKTLEQFIGDAVAEKLKKAIELPQRIQ
jgi:hypothetical protein